MFARACSAALPGLALACVLLLPFLGKAFTIDDTLFLHQAETALSDPLHPSAMTLVWSQTTVPVRLSQVMPNGPVMAWLLAPALLAGGSETAGHLVELALLLLAIVEVAALALRLDYGEEVATLASLLLAATPTVLAMAGTVMPDVAAMTLGLVGVERLLAWRQGGGAAAALLAAMGLALAPLARSHTFVLLGVAAFLLDAPWSPEGRRQWLPLAAAPLLSFAILVVTRDPIGASTDLMRTAGEISGLEHVRSNAIAFGVHWLLLLPLGAAWIVANGVRFWKSPLPWLAMAVAAVLFVAGGETSKAWLAPVAGLGGAVVVDVLRRAIEERRVPGRLALALWLLVALPLLVYLHLPSKYLVASAPAAAIIAAAAIVALPRRRAILAAGTIVAAGSLLGVALLSADAAFAGLARRAVDELVKPHVAAGENVWFNVHWGFQWYAEKAGAKCVTSTPPRPKAGDLVVSAKTTITGYPVQALGHRELVATVRDDSPGGRIISPELGVGYYSNGWGYLPWAWSSGELDRFDLWRLR